MSAANHHRIDRQVLELELASVARATELQEEAALPFRRGSPEIEELFDRLAGPDEIVRVDRLELDLGELRGADWRDQLVARLLDRLRDSLAAATGRPADRQTEPAHRPSPRDALFEQFLFFLAHGRLPWWGRRPPRPWSEAPELRDTVRLRSLGELVRRDQRARHRLVLTVDDGFLAALVAELSGLEECERVMRVLVPASIDAEGRRRWRRRFWRETLGLALAEGPAAERGPELIRRLLPPPTSAAPPEQAAPPPGPERPGEGPVPASEAVLPEPWRSWLENARCEMRQTPSATAGAPESESTPAPAPGDREPPRARPEGVRVDTPPAEAAPPERRPEIAPPSATPALASDAPRDESPGPATVVDEAVYVDGAGVVILHPFVQELFASRELLDGRRFRDEAARAHAVHLLGHLTFGNDEAPEYDLLLPKLLCAMPWEEPLPPGTLDKDDLAACDELLAAVLGHWKALQSASPAWLREQFFLRDGKLEPVDGGWKLTVERRAQDVLLTGLPWGLGMIRLPWMQELLHVSWAE